MIPRIEHLVDEVVGDDGTVDQEYNYLLYRWEEAGVAARAYLDEPHTVSILTGEPSPEILAYLRARYARLQRLGRTGYDLLEEARS